MVLFYSPEISNADNFLSEEESFHCIKVLRKSIGDTIHVTDGKGSLFTATITQANIQQCEYKINNVEEEYGIKPYQLQIGICPTKNNKRFEWFLEKATEVGVDVITPIICNNSERREVKPDRLKKVAVVAMKQSLKTYLPLIEPAINFKDFLTKTPISANEQRFIANQDPSHSFLIGKYEPGCNATVLIGPEGDFDQDELALAKTSGFDMVNLGHSRLRTETAGLVACTTIGLVNDAR